MRLAGLSSTLVLEPAEAACRGAGCRVPFRGVRLGMRAPGPRRHDGPKPPLRQSGAEGVDVIGPVRDQAGQQGIRPRLR